MKLCGITMSRARVLVASALVAGGGVLMVPSFAAAHHNTVSCQSPGVWLIVNSEADKAESFTTNEGHAGDIPAGGSTTVEFSGTSLIVYGTWTNGVTDTATGTGDCTDVETTVVETTVVETTIVETSEPETTEPVETTIVETTEPETTEPVETTIVDTTEPDTTVVETTQPDTTVVETTTPTTVPPTAPPVCADDPTTPDNDCAEPCSPTGIDADGNQVDDGVQACQRLPATGTDSALPLVAGVALVATGLGVLGLGRRRDVNAG